jgi:hypothetical protein
LKQYANVNLFIVRQQLTNKGFFVQSMKLLQETQFENVGLVMNGIKVKKYGNDYGYGYGAGYVSSVKHSDLSETPTV